MASINTEAGTGPSMSSVTLDGAENTNSQQLLTDFDRALMRLQPQPEELVKDPHNYIREGSVIFYKNGEPAQYHILLFNDALILTEAPDSDHFTIEVVDKVHFKFACESKGERDAWVSDIKKACNGEFPAAIARVTRSKEEAKQSYNSMAEWYDVMAGNFEKEFRDAGLEELSCKEGESVLEVGFGTGHAIVEMCKRVGTSGRVYGVDISEEMVRLTKERAKEFGVDDRIELHCGDALYLPFEDKSMDAVFMSFALELFDTPEIPLLLAECQRVMKPSARIVVVAMSKRAEGVMMSLYEWGHNIFPDLVDCRPIFAAQTLRESGFSVANEFDMPMWGLKVSIVRGNVDLSV